MDNIPIAGLRELAHLDVSHLGGRSVELLSLHDGEVFHVWVPANGRLLHTASGALAEARYYAAKPARPGDLHFSFLEFLSQRVSWTDIVPVTGGLADDVQNLSASLAKLRLIFDYGERDAEPSAARRMVVTEIEYVFMVCRSIFDAMQKAVCRLWRRTKLYDSSALKAELPDSYRKVVLSGGAKRSAEDIAERFGLPLRIAHIYAQSSDFFLWLRAYRDLVSHHGRTPDWVFRMDDGFAIRRDVRPFDEMSIWCDSNSRPNELGSLLAVFGHLITMTLRTGDALASGLAETINFPPPLAPNYRVFVRGPHIHHLVPAERFIAAEPWYGPGPSVSEETRGQ